MKFLCFCFDNIASKILYVWQSPTTAPFGFKTRRYTILQCPSGRGTSCFVLEVLFLFLKHDTLKTKTEQSIKEFEYVCKDIVEEDMILDCYSCDNLNVEKQKIYFNYFSQNYNYCLSTGGPRYMRSSYLPFRVCSIENCPF